MWFRDSRLQPDDQDHQWPACFIIDALTAGDAASWGDQLSQDYVWRTGLQRLSSSAESAETADVAGLNQLPIIPFGHYATDAELGW